MEENQKHPGGRPRIYEDPQELTKKIIEYFFSEQTDCGNYVFSNDLSECITMGMVIKKPTVNGLALFLGFADKSTLYEYRDRPEFSYPIKASLTLIEQYHEERLSENNVTGAIFALKNMGWKDKTEQDVNVTGAPIQIIMPPDEPPQEQE